MSVAANFCSHRMPFTPELKSLQAVRLRTLSLIEPLDQKQLDYAPAHGKWSIGEIVDHILLAQQFERGLIEELILLSRSGKRPFVRRTLLQFELRPAFLPRRLILPLEPLLSFFSTHIPPSFRAWVITRRPVPFRGPAQAAPRRCLPGNDLRKRLLTSHESIASLYETNADLDFHTLVARHSMLGSMDMIEMLRIMAYHETRHQKQISRTMRRLPGVG